MSSLDKSLDDIISSNKKSRKAVKGKLTKGKGIGKVNRAAAAPKVNKQALQRKVEQIKGANLLDSTYATKVVVYGLPKDIKQDAIKSQVGGIQNLVCSYNERGQFKGIATVIFKSSKFASKAVEKYNGAPIDGGSSKLKLELIIDPSKKPLATRIGSAAPAAGPSLKERIQAKKSAQKTAQKKAQVPAVTAKTRPKAQAAPAKKKAPKKTKKTVEELDQEMADYFK